MQLLVLVFAVLALVFGVHGIEDPNYLHQYSVQIEKAEEARHVISELKEVGYEVQSFESHLDTLLFVYANDENPQMLVKLDAVRRKYPDGFHDLGLPGTDDEDFDFPDDDLHGGLGDNFDHFDQEEHEEGEQPVVDVDHEDL